jgi:hypothetical protein
MMIPIRLPFFVAEDGRHTGGPRWPRPKHSSRRRRRRRRRRRSDPLKKRGDADHHHHHHHPIVKGPPFDRRR